MNWLSNITPPGMKKIFRQRDDTGDTKWSRCSSCEEMIFLTDLEAAQQVCPNCDHHMYIAPVARLDGLFNVGQWERIEVPNVSDDPLKFKDSKKYTERLRENRKKTGEHDALVLGKGQIGSLPAVAAVQNFSFMGGSMGMALGEGILRAAETAIENKAALIIFSASGGARMQEGILSLMQMPRTTIAVQMMRDAKLPYIVVLTHPTTGGVTASYAMLGDIHLAEPNALIGFAGPRVIEQTIREKLPEGFQRAEYLLEKGMVDQVVHRHSIPEVLASLLSTLMKAPAAIVQLAAPANTDQAPSKPVANQPTSGEDTADSLPKAAE